MSPNMQDQMRKAIQAANDAREKGNHPFGAVLAGPDGETLLIAENTVNTDRDPTAHAETNLVRMCAQQFEAEFLNHCTLYASAEPCPMCAGAIYWSNIGRVVFGLSQDGINELAGGDPKDSLRLSCREVLSHGGRKIEVLGPMLEEEARAVHLGFWEAQATTDRH